ncbi:MAG TPA: AsmA-like C-terminal region-containing protein, partial [Steroidobacteraceae bacterium]|nr:AsmA-like C-terminal region-containing protein [Steroidobacteraceae bacterium]
WRFYASPLSLGDAHRAHAAPGSLVLEVSRQGGRWRGELHRLPLELLTAAAQWLAPQVQWHEAQLLDGRVPQLFFDWNRAHAPGARLHFAGTLEPLELRAAGRGIALQGLSAQLSGTESELRAELHARAARVLVPRAPALSGVRLISRWRVRRHGEDWELATEHTQIEHERARLSLAGALILGPEPSMALRALLTDVDLGTLRGVLGGDLSALAGALGQRVVGGQIRHGELEWRGPLAGSALQARAFSGSLAVANGALAAGDGWPAIAGLEGRLEWHGPIVRASISHATGGPLELNEIDAQWRLPALEPGAGGAAQDPLAWRASGQAQARLEALLPWLAEHPDLLAFAAAATRLDASGNARLSFSASQAAALGGHAPLGVHLRIAAQLAAEHVRFAAAAPPLENLSGTLLFEDGELQRSTLQARWLGGATQLRLAERRTAGVPGLALQLTGTAQARAVLALAGIDPAPAEVSGATAWRGELSFAPSSTHREASWHAQADSTLIGIASQLGGPFSKSASSGTPLHVAASGDAHSALAQLDLGADVHGAFALDVNADGGWRAQRGALHFGPGAARLDPQAALRVEGRLARLDLPAWLAVWRRVSLLPQALPLSADLAIDELTLPGQRYVAAHLSAAPSNDGFVLRIDSSGLAGVIRWVTPAAAATPVEVHLQRLALMPSSARASEYLPLAALAPDVQLAVERVSWAGRSLGSLRAHLHTAGDALSIDAVRLSNDAEALEASLHCESVSVPCRLAFKLDSVDAATTLRDFGLRADVSAERAALQGELTWPRELLLSERSPWASASGTLSLSLHDGAVPSARAPSGQPFALLAVAELLRDSAHGTRSVASAAVAPAGAAAPADSAAEAARDGVRFTQLSASYRVHDGSAFTSDLQLDGDAEILMSGRIGLLAQDYDCRAWVLRGEERLPAAVRRFASTPHVAAAWMAWRDLFSGSAPSEQLRSALRLSGSWQAPRIEATR